MEKSYQEYLDRMSDRINNKVQIYIDEVCEDIIKEIPENVLKDMFDDIDKSDYEEWVNDGGDLRGYIASRLFTNIYVELQTEEGE